MPPSLSMSTSPPYSGTYRVREQTLETQTHEDNQIISGTSFLGPSQSITPDNSRPTDRPAQTGQDKITDRSPSSDLRCMVADYWDAFKAFENIWD